MKNIDRYLRLVNWALCRYSRADGVLVTHIGGAPTVYSRIELAAARKYLPLGA